MYQSYDKNSDRPETGAKHVKTASFFIKTGFSFVKNRLQNRLRPGCTRHGDPGAGEVQTRVCTKPRRVCTKPRRVCTKPRRVCTKPRRVCTKPRRVCTKPRRVCTKPRRVCTKPRRVCREVYQPCWRYFYALFLHLIRRKRSFYI